MKIDLTNEMIEMESGPNLYFMGSIPDYIKLKKVFFDLSQGENSEVMLDDIFNELISSPVEVVFRSKKGGAILSKIKDGNVLMELDFQLWKRIALMVCPLSEKKAHCYVEFDDLDLRDDCNVIMSSEW